MKISIVLHMDIPTHYTSEDIQQIAIEIAKHVNYHFPEDEKVIDTETITEPSED